LHIDEIGDFFASLVGRDTMGDDPPARPAAAEAKPAK
jgi:hypothetical protein